MSQQCKQQDLHSPVVCLIFESAAMLIRLQIVSPAGWFALMKYFAQFPSSSLNSFQVVLSDGRQCGDSLPYLKVRPPNVFSLLGCKKYPDFPFSLQMSAVHYHLATNQVKWRRVGMPTGKRTSSTPRKGFPQKKSSLLPPIITGSLHLTHTTPVLSRTIWWDGMCPYIDQCLVNSPYDGAKHIHTQGTENSIM